MNKYLSRGIILTIIGIVIGLFGNYLQDKELDFYKWVLTLAVIIFGIGFLTIIYSLIRRIERTSILQERSESQDETDENT